MRKSSWPVVLVIILFCALGWYAYRDVTESKNLPQGVEEQSEFKTTVVEAYQRRDSIPLIAMLLFPALVWGMAVSRAVVHSWLRTILSTMIAIVLIFTMFTNLMDSTLQAKDPSYILPFDKVVGVAEWATVWTLISLGVWLWIEYLYVRRIAPNA